MIMTISFFVRCGGFTRADSLFEVSPEVKINPGIDPEAKNVLISILAAARRPQ